MATKVNIKIINYLKASLRGIQIKDDLIHFDVEHLDILRTGSGE